MSKKFYVLTILITLAISATIVSLFVYYSKKNSMQNNVTETVKKIGEDYTLFPIEKLREKTTLEIQTEKGTVPINNVYKDPVEKLSMNGVAFVNNSDYYMAFYPQDNGFLISINSSDVVSAERKAEKSFLKQLGITEEQACELKVSITVPYSVSEEYSGGNYTFSFCPDGNPLN